MSTAPATDSATTAATTDPKAMVDAWLRFWNGDLSLASGIVSDDFRLHTVFLDGSSGASVKGPEDLASHVKGGRAAFPDLEFAIEVPPLVDGPYLSVRWTATGTYAAWASPAPRPSPGRW